jgi:3-hydroxybenzoate 6-monooxygenase
MAAGMKRTGTRGANGSSELPILIAGGGIGGLATALALSRRGVPAHVLEQSAAFAETGAGIQIGPNGFGMLVALGIDGTASRAAHFPDYLVMRDSSSGREIVRVAVGAPEFLARYRHPYAVMYRPDLLDSLLEACQAATGVTLSTDAKVVAFEAEGSRVRVGTARGEIYEGAAFIGADGLRSRVRMGVVGDGEPRVTGHVAYRAVLRAIDIRHRPGPDSVVLWSGPGRHLVHYPVRRGALVNVVAVLDEHRFPQGLDAGADRDFLAACYEDAIPEVRALITQVDRWGKWSLFDREPIRHWSKGRITLVGDAAHPMLQYLAQGACMALEDATVLARNVAEHGGDHERAFAAYERERYVRTARVQLASRFFGDLYHAAGVAAEVRDALFRDGDPGSATGMSWLYEGIAA